MPQGAPLDQVDTFTCDYNTMTPYSLKPKQKVIITNRFVIMEILTSL